MKSSIAAPSRRNSGFEATSKSASGRALADRLGDLAVGADGHRRFHHDHGMAGQRRGDFGRRAHHIGQVGMAVAAPGRRADGDEDRLGARHRGRQIAAEAQPPGLDVAAHQIF
jgi:hypothetical protein